MTVYQVEWVENGSVMRFRFTDRAYQSGWLVLTRDEPGDWAELLLPPGLAASVGITRAVQ